MGRVARWLLVFGVLAVVLAGYVEYERRTGLYWYDVDQDYRYRFPSGSATKVPIQITATGFAVPALVEDWDTAILPVALEATFSGRLLEPAIELWSDKRSSTQYFERGARGTRFLVIEPELLEPGRVVNMSGIHVTWPEQGRELLLFRTPEVSQGPVLVIAPHPDDAEIAAFGLYSSADAYVVTVTAGDSVDTLYQHLVPEHAERRELRGRVRVWDSLVVPTWGSVAPERIVNLGYWNDSLAGLYENRGEPAGVSRIPGPDPAVYRAGAVSQLLGDRPAQGTWESLVMDFETLIRTVHPAVIIAPHPALDAAPDHRFTTLGLLEALTKVTSEDAILLLYTNHHVLAEYYPFGPADTTVTLPPWFDETLQFGGVFSFALGDAEQRRKLFALESMHDLRAPPSAVTAVDPLKRFFNLASSAFQQLRRNPLGTYSYYRRAIRTNELFFVYRPAERNMITTTESQGFQYR